MRPLSHLDQIAFADLCVKAFDAITGSAFPLNGNVVVQKRGDREYYYFKSYEKATDTARGEHSLRYLGSVADETLREKVENFLRLKQDYRTRRQLAATLRKAGLPTPMPLEGKVLDALSSAGAWDRIVLVGTLAYQTYAGLLAVRLDDAAYRTQDADFAEFAVRGRNDMIDLPALLTGIDPSFEPLFHPGSQNVPVGYRNRAGYKVEILVPARKDPAAVYRSSTMAHTGAQSLKYLEYLIKDPTRSVTLHEAGVPVIVPAPERYAVHKLIVTCLRGPADRAKVAKDVTQAGAIMEAKRLTGMEIDLGVAWADAWRRGPRWRRFLALGAERLPEAAREALEVGIEKIARIEGLDAAALMPWRGPARPAEGGPTKIGGDEPRTHDHRAPADRTRARR